MADVPNLILYDLPMPHVARITLNRPDTANAQDTQWFCRRNEALDRAHP